MKSLMLGLITTVALSLPAVAEMNNHGHMHKEKIHPNMPHEQHENHRQIKEGVHANGELHMIDGEKVNLSHGPIPAIGWPAMRMDLPLLEGAEVGDVKPGDKIMFILDKGTNGMYGVRAVMPQK